VPARPRAVQRGGASRRPPPIPPQRRGALASNLAHRAPPLPATAPDRARAPAAPAPTPRNIVGCYGVGRISDAHPRHPSALFIVQQLVQGLTLATRVHAAAAAPPPVTQPCGGGGSSGAAAAGCSCGCGGAWYSDAQALDWVLDVAEGLEYLHAREGDKPTIMHRRAGPGGQGLKPAAGAAAAFCPACAASRRLPGPPPAAPSRPRASHPLPNRSPACAPSQTRPSTPPGT
jgi:hypothetical protein